MKKGKVKWYNPKKGFGIILSDNIEFFVHHSEILGEKNKFKNLHIDEDVEFERGVDVKNKVCAIKVKSLNKSKLDKKKKRYKNTENFNPSHKPSDMRIIIGDPNKKTFDREMQSRDITLVNGLFCESDDLSIYNRLLEEVNKCDKDKKLWKMWHGDSHFIVDDKLNWKEDCPTFGKIIKKIEDYFQMNIQATRFNWYKNSSHWKPFHHDAAAIKPHIAAKQNFTVGISFGAERDAAFENAKNKTVLSIPLPNGSIYCFAKDVNIMWKHGILQTPPDKKNDRGRISIIAWGKNKQIDI